MSYFHFTMARLQSGSVIEPGNWGRLLRRYQHKPAEPGHLQYGNAWLLARELVFEMSRLAIKPNGPSRFDSCFVIPTRDAADRYRDANDQFGTTVLHEVEIVDEAAPFHNGYLSLVVFPRRPEFLDDTRALADSYWRSTGTGDMEVVTLSPLRVIRCLD